MVAMASRLTRRRFLVQSAATTTMIGVSSACKSGAGKRRHASDIREVSDLVVALPSADGAGVKLRRAMGHSGLPDLDPFLLLDEIHSDRQEDWIAGFPSHPHRGFETVSYLIAGSFEHRDSVGNHGVIGAGDCQWMTAGRGIIHSEMPRQVAGQDLWGLQLWVNLPAKDKMGVPRYQDVPASDIPELQLGDAHCRLVTGILGSTQGPIDRIAVAPVFLDVTVPPGALFHHELPAAHSSFVYMLSGSAHLGAKASPVPAGSLAVLGKGREIMASSEFGGRFLLLAGQPIGEPVARRGPFVMNTAAELRQAFADYRSGKLI
jgi:redox-sensitive bicupin YhaK (pirin superfamily)